MHVSIAVSVRAEPAHHDQSVCASLQDMTCYAIAQLRIHDAQRYGRYVGGFMPTLNRYGGKVLAADNGPLVVEGQWPFQKLVLLAFDDADAFHRWEASPEYQAIVADRKDSAVGPVILVRGI